ncbi:MAG: hypothetical protein HZA53_03115, partial [Planctomycetes bacterium]|nr:hypothetical protein [Planctomycetota bacterium]
AAVALAAALFLAWRFARAESFGLFMEYDDQGFLEVVVRHLLEGRAPYDAIAVPYGPIYLLERYLLHAVLGAPLGTDGVRWITTATWLLAALAFGVGVARALRGSSGAWAAGIAALLLVALHVKDIALEPGHPQELYLLLAAALSAAAVGAGERARASAVLWGVLGGALLLVKANLGVFALVAGLLGVRVFAGGSRRARAAELALALLAVGVPCALMRTRLGTPWVREFALGSTLALAALAACVWRARREQHAEPRPPKTLVAFVLGVLGALALGAGFAFARGASPGALVDQLFLAPLRLPTAFELALPERPFVLLVTLAGCACAALHAFGPPAARELLRRRGLPVLRLLFLALVVAAGTDGALLFEYGAGWAWVLAAPFATPSAPGIERWRTTLVWFALLERLQAFPVAGSQIQLGQVALVPLAIWGAVDAAGALARGSSTARAGFACVLVLFAGALTWLRGSGAAEVEARSQPLALAGAERTRTAPDAAARLRWLAHNLARGPSTFVSVIGSNSLYGWTGKPPPVVTPVSHAWDLVTPAQEAELLDALARAPDAWIVDHPGLLAPLQRGDRPFFATLARDYRPFARHGGYVLCARKDQPVPRLTACAWSVERRELPAAVAARVPAGSGTWIELALGPAAPNFAVRRVRMFDVELRHAVAGTDAKDPREQTLLFDARGTACLAESGSAAWAASAAEPAFLHAPFDLPPGRTLLLLLDGPRGNQPALLPVVERR